MLADCGADPHYVFADLENLIRKARIDMATTIDFIDPGSLWPSLDESLSGYFGTPDSITSSPGDQHLLLARIRYPSGASGCLLVVKPRCCDKLTLDVAGYADSHPDFPQQSTAEQFFDEAQWESYCQLGAILGKIIDPSLMKKLPGLAETGGVASINTMGAEDGLAGSTRRQRISATLGASLGVGVLVTIALAGWQAWDGRATSARLGERLNDSQQRAADAVQTDLESGAAYDSKLHARLYALMQKFDRDGMTAALHKLAQPLNRACDRLDQASALFDRCLEDDSAMRTAKAEPTDWQKSMRDYVNATRDPAISRPDGGVVSGQIVAAMQKVCNGGALTQPQRIAVYTQISSEPRFKSALDLQNNFTAFGLANGGIENITPTAEERGLQTPVGWSMPVFLYSTDGDQAQSCARSLARWLATQKGYADTMPRALSVALPPHGDTDAIEFWLPDSSTPVRR